RRRGAAAAPASPTPSPPLRRRPRLPRARPGSATSLAEQLVQQSPLEVRGRALGAAAGAEKSQEHLLEIEVLPARHAPGQVLADLRLRLRRQLLVQELVQVLLALAAIHAGLPLM